MKLIASLMSANRYDELLAVIDVQNDTAEPWGNGFRRKITGTVRQTGPIWNAFVQFWRKAEFMPCEEDGKRYFSVECLQVDRDLYGFSSWMSVQGNAVDLILLEGFSGTPEEYYQEVKARNRQIEDGLAVWERGDLTRNDYRELRGFPRIDKPFFDEKLPTEALVRIREHFANRNRKELGVTYNLIV